MFSVLNGQRFFRQGTGTPPEFRANGTSADTRAVTEHKCGLGYHKEKSVESLISARRLPTNEPSENKPPVSHHQDHLHMTVQTMDSRRVLGSRLNIILGTTSWLLQWSPI